MMNTGVAPPFFFFLNRVEEESISDHTYYRSKGNERTGFTPSIIDGR